MRRIIILKCGKPDSRIENKYGNFEQWIINKTNLPERLFSIYDVEGGEMLRHPGDFVAGIITGSHSMITERKTWMKTLGKWIIEAKYCNLPLLGICFGHHAIAAALGGKVQLRNTGPEQGKITVSILKEGMNDPIFKGIESKFETYALHEQSIIELPKNAIHFAKSNLDAFQSFKIGKFYGIQFHPEFTSEIMSEYLKIKYGNVNNIHLHNEYNNNQIISNFLDSCFQF